MYVYESIYPNVNAERSEHPLTLKRTKNAMSTYLTFICKANNFFFRVTLIDIAV